MSNYLEVLLEKYNEWNDFKVLENANKYPGPTGYFSMVAELTLEEQMKDILPRRLYELHESGLIFIHKLPFSLYIPYCTGHSIKMVLKRGLKTPTIISRPARHFDTMVDHVANFLFTMQHYFTGAQALSSIEWYSAPFIKFDNLSYKTVKQNVQRLVYNLNYPTRIALQTPFTNFTFTMDASRKLIEEKCIHGGVEVGTLSDYEEQAKSFLLSFIEILNEGDATGQIFAFPIPTLMTTSKWLWEDPEIYEATFKTAARRGSFYWLNTRVVDPDSTMAMCCRLSINRMDVVRARTTGFRLTKDIEDVHEEYMKGCVGGIWSVPDFTGSINVIDVNLPRLALESKGEESRFWELYDAILEVIKLGLMWFRERYIKLISTYPEVYRMVQEYLPGFPSFHFNTVGLIGLPEAAAILMNNPKLWLDGNRSDWLRATEIIRKMVEFSVKKTREWSKEYRVPWNVEEVPGESAAAKLASKDLRVHPELVEYLPDPNNPIYSTSIAPYYTPMELYDRVEIEQRVQKFFTGGVMMHIFLDEEPEPEALAKLTERLMQTDLVYWSYTPAITYCNRCSKTYTGLHISCPRCGSNDVEIWSRIVGYYRPLKNWNPYRKKEFWSRKHYKAQSFQLHY